MPDREYVIKTLKKIKAQTKEIGLDKAVLAHKFMDEIIELLKKQEAVEPEYGGDMEWEQIRKQQYPENGTWWYECGYCRTPIDYRDRFCRHCGQAVKWE